LYPFPNSKAWQNLPKSKGLDIADWIEQHQITADDIKAVIGEKKVFTAPQAAAKVVTDDRFKLSSVDLRQEITALVNAGTTGSELTAALLELSRGSNAQQVERIYKEILEEADREEQRFDRKADIEKLQEISGRKLALEKYLHPSLAEPIKKVSAWMGVDPEAVLTHLLPISAGLINPNSRVVAKRCINFVEPLLIYSGVVALTGSRKSPLLDIVKSPLVKLQTEEEERDSIAWKVYQDELRSFNESKDKDKGDPPKEPPPPREFYVDNITVESLDKIKGQQPNHALTLIKDELSGLFASHGQYKGGKGSDKESFLSGWNGKGIKKNRCSKDSRVSLARDSLSVTGGIQPDKLRALLGDFRDAQGEWARFLWYHMPMRPYKIPRDDTSYSLGDLLEATYRKLNSLPALEFSFDKDGQNFFDDWHDRKDEQKRKQTRLGLQAAIAKMPGQAVRIIGLLHVLNGVSSQSASVQTKIP
jgi:CRISPR-associated protein Cmr3